MPKYYRSSEIVFRIIWGIINPFFFKFSPRLLYEWRNFILRVMGAKIGKNVQIFPTVRITYPWLLEVGDGTVISWDVRIYNLGKIKIGSHTVISQHSHLCGGTHRYDSVGFPLVRTGLTIGNDVWIAADAFVGPGVFVGDRSVIGARAVVMKDVASGCVMAGNPAQVIKMR
jgi:putative colanic acid biosynthesis acetyltransferase WcaF